MQSDNSDFAERGETQSGQRFLDSSAPRLKRHSASCETAGGESFSPSAGKEEKLSPEFEGGALIGAEGAVPSLLVSYTNNRNTSQPDLTAIPKGRGKHCGRYSIRGIDPKTGRVCFRRINCNSWTCPYCGPRRHKLAKRAIRATAEELGLSRFLTLTLDPSKLQYSNKESVRYLRECFNKFRTYLRRKYGETLRYISVLEFQENGMPHLHILIDRYIPWAWVRSIWQRLGGGWHVNIKRVTIRNVSRYLAKYLTKDLLLSAPKGTRRITTARAIRLFPKFQSGIDWELLRTTIWHLYSIHRAKELPREPSAFRIVDVECDAEQYLRAFAIACDSPSPPPQTRTLRFSAEFSPC